MSLPSAAVLAAAAAAGAGLVVAAAAIVAAGTFARPGTRYIILAAAFVLTALIGPGALTVALLRPAAERVLGIDGGAAFAGPLLIGAAALAVALLAELALDMARLRAIKHAARPIGAIPVRRARVAVSAAVATPTAIGYLRPAIVVPAGFRRRVDGAEWNAVIAHEAAHLRRGDDWAKAAQSAVLRLAWWLPGLWILAGQLDVERELASDERAVGTTGVRRYAACLLRLATSDASASVAPALWVRRTQVAIRVERLLRPVAPVSALARAMTLGAATAATLAVLAAALLAVPPLGRPAGHALRIAVARPPAPPASPAPRRAVPTVVGLAPKAAGAARIAPPLRV